MKLFRYFILYCLAMFFVNTFTYAQNISFGNIDAAKSYLSSKGISEDEFVDALKSKGYDVNNTQYAYILQNKPLIQSVVDELEANKLKKTPQQGTTTFKNPVLLNDTVQRKLINPQISNVKRDSAKIISQPELVVPSIEFKSSGIYGHDLFENKQVGNYMNLKDVSPPNSYILGPGDRINVLIFGKSQADLIFEINAEGFIQPNSMPKLFLKGLSLKQAKEYLLNRFSSYYLFNTGQFAVTIQSARQVNVNIFGEVNKPGIYSISGLNTILNALALAGGPSAIGTVRNIQLIRNGIKLNFDIYDFLENPSRQFDFFIQNNDVIYVPLVGKIVSASGAINRNAQFELNEKEGINDIIKFAGGIQSTTLTELVQIERIENNQIVLLEYSLEDLISEKLKIDIKKGDKLRFKKINSPVKDYVLASGAFYYTGQYDYESTKSLKSLITKAKFLQEANLQYAFIYRDNFDNSKKTIPVLLSDILDSKMDVPLIKGDEVFVFDKSQITDIFKISVSGEVRNPFSNNFRFDDSLKIVNALELAGGLKSNSFKTAYIIRNNPFKPKKTTYIPIDLNVDKNFYLVPGDEFLVLNKSDFEFEKGIRIIGEVNSDYVTRFDSSLTLKDLFALAKGKTLLADLQNIEVLRLNISGNQFTRSTIDLSLNENFEVTNFENFTLRPFDIVVVRKIPNSKFQDLVSLKGEVKYPGPYMLKKDKYFFSDLIKDAGGFTDFFDLDNIVLNRPNEGKVIFSALDALNNAGEIFKDPILQPNDEISVGLINNTVRINLIATKLLSDLQNSLIITYQGKKSARWYINNFAGGFEEKADRNSLNVISKSGKVTKTFKILFFRKYPKLMTGDQISLKFKVVKESKSTDAKPFDWEKLSSKIITIFTALALIQAYIK
jgi:protein involved in polysaccharide export with SLBB domain